jgi:hypothetical protein
MARDPNAKNTMENSSGKGWAPPSGKFHPPAAGAHTPESVHRISGGTGTGPQGPGVHPSLRKPKQS